MDLLCSLGVEEGQEWLLDQAVVPVSALLEIIGVVQQEVVSVLCLLEVIYFAALGQGIEETEVWRLSILVDI